MAEHGNTDYQILATAKACQRLLQELVDLAAIHATVGPELDEDGDVVLCGAKCPERNNVYCHLEIGHGDAHIGAYDYVAWNDNGKVVE